MVKCGQRATWFTAILALAAGLAEAQQKPATEADYGHWRALIREALYVPAKLPPLEAKVWGTFTPVEGVVAERVTYRTAQGMLVPAIVYRPEHVAKGTKLPGIVVVNGHGGDKFSWYAVYSGMLFARGGATVVTYDPIGEGERNSGKKSMGDSHDAPAPEGVSAEDWGRRLGGLMQVDEMQAVAYLKSRPEVDAKRIATVGYSMGAFVSGLTGAIDTDIHAVLLSGGGTFDDAADGGNAYDLGTRPCQTPPWRSLLVLGPEPHRRGAVLYALNAQRGPMLVVNGSNDGVMDIPHRGPEWFAGIRAQAVALRGTERDMFMTHVDAGMGHRTAWVERPSVVWLNDQIHFPNWSAAQITGMPVIQAGEWVARTGAQMSKGYGAPDREGGLMALNPVGGGGFPAVKRAALMVLPEDAWEQRKGELTYEGWREKMIALESKPAAETTPAARF